MLPEYILRNSHAMQIIQMASEKRLEETTRRFIVEGRVRSAEQHLEALRQELMETDRNLQEIEDSIRTLHDLVLPIRDADQMVDAPVLYHSDVSSPSISPSSSIIE